MHVLVAGIAAPSYVAHAYLMLRFFSFNFSSAVCGYHVYQDNWEPDIGDQLYCEGEPGNGHDTFTVAVKNDTAMVGHVPRIIS